MRVLISGAGIAGPTLAFWLAHHGFEPTIVEKAPHLRTGGYIIDFWGLGFDIADRMGLLPRIFEKGYTVREVRIVDGHGKRIAGFPVDAVSRIVEGRYVSVARGDLAACIFRAIGNRAETIFNDSIAGIDQRSSGVRVSFESGATREFDLVVGADGLHSRVRELVFGPQSQFEKYLGCKVAAFEVSGYRPRDELAYVMHSEVSQQVGRFAMRDDRTMFLFTFADPESESENASEMSVQKALLRRRFVRSGWECPQILEALDRTRELYFDRVSQVRMGSEKGSWTRGRVTLAGDAAHCVSLLAGQGSGLAMIGAYILAGELHRSGGNYAVAFANYQQSFEPFILKKQKAALHFAGFFAPKSYFSMFLRNQVINLLRIRWVADLAAGRDLADKFALPDYG